MAALNRGWVKILLSNQTQAHGLYAEYGPGYIGHIYSPDGWRNPHELPYALDNGAFPAWEKGRPFDGDAYHGMLDKAAALDRPPMWALVPDVVGDRDGTLRSWDEWLPIVTQYGWPLAFAAQDGMTADDVPLDHTSVVFVGGTTAWKLRTMPMWCHTFARVHIGRVNTLERLLAAHRLGAESIDGTGWFHRKATQWYGLLQYLEHVARGEPLAQTAFDFAAVTA